MTANFHPWRLIGTLGVTMILSWGGLYYAIAILAADIGRETGWRGEIVMGAFSWCLLVAGLAAMPAGAWLDRYGGRVMMSLGSLLCGAGLVLLSQAQTVAVYFFAWTVLGLAMALVLYEAAFASIIREMPDRARRSISTLTLFGGFASTVFWPLTLYLNRHLGWRDTYLLYGAVQLLVCLPLHASMPARPHGAAAHADPGAASHTLAQALRHPAFWKLAFAFAGYGFTFTALSVQLIPLLHGFGHPLTVAVLMASLIGPVQVAGRIAEMSLGHRTTPQNVGIVTFAALPAGLLALTLFGTRQWMVALFCLLYGFANGVVTIVRGAVPQALFGARNYGAISGAMAGPALLSKAAAPLAAAAIVARLPAPQGLLAILLAVSLLSFALYLAAIRGPAPGRPQPA